MTTEASKRRFFYLIGGSSHADVADRDGGVKIEGANIWKLTNGSDFTFYFTAEIAGDDRIVVSLDGFKQRAVVSKPIEKLDVSHILRGLYSMAQAALAEFSGLDLLPLDQQDTWGVFGG